MNELLIDEETGEIIPAHVMVKAETVPSIILDVKEVDKHFNEPMKLVEMINKQAGFCVFDIKTKKGQDECRSHAAKIIRCIAPVIKRYKELEEDAQKIVNQGRNARKLFESGVREIAEYHRKPLTDFEEEQAKIAEQERIFAEKMEAMRLYQLDWDDAIAYDELFTLRKEKAVRDAEAAALKQLQEQEEYEKQLQAQAIIKERERHEQEIEQLKRAQEAQILKIKQEKPLQANEENIIVTESVAISIDEYESLKADSARLHEIVDLWKQYERLSQSALRAESKKDQIEDNFCAAKIQKRAVDLIKSTSK